MKPEAWRSVGFLLLMLGFGLRLDTGWEALAWLLLAAGAACLGVGAWTRSELPAFVPRQSRR